MKKHLILILILTSLSFGQSRLLLLFDDDEGYSTEAQQYFARLTTPTTGDTLDWIAELIDTLALYPTGDPVWTSLDEAWLLANNNTANALQGLKGYKNATAVNSPTFTQWEGFAGNGSSSYLNTNYNPSTQGVVYTQNSASIGVYSRTDINADVIDIGGRGTTNYSQLYIRPAAVGFIFRINQGSGSNLVANANSLGMHSAVRIASDTTRAYKNGSLLSTAATVSTGLPNTTFYICAQSDKGTAGLFTTRRYSFAFVGGGLTAAQVKVLTDAVERYLDHLGKGVIP